MKRFLKNVALLAALVLLLSAADALAETGIVNVLGVSVPKDTETLSLDGVKMRDGTALAQALAQLPRTRTVSLEGCGLKVKHLSALFAAFPEVMFLTSFDLYGHTLHTWDTEVDLGKTKVTAYQTLLGAIRSMPDLKHMTAFGATLTRKRYEEALSLRPGLKLDCTLNFLTYSLRTDATAFSTRKGNEPPFYKNRDFEILQYVPGLLALDLGHNRVSDLAFLRQWPNMKILIMADNAITDLGVIGEMSELEYLELFMNPFTDIAPLTRLTKLKDLNISWTAAADVMPLAKMVWLERLWITGIKPKLPAGQADALRAALPGCEINDTAWLSTQGGWRDHPRYFTQANIFGTRVYRDWDAPAP